MDASSPGAHIVKSGSASRRAAIIGAGLVALVAGSFFIPSRHHVTQQAIVVPRSLEGVASEVGGIIQAVQVRTGQWVERGDLLATLENPEITADLRIADAARQQARVEFGSLRRSGGWAGSESQAYAAQQMEVAEASYRIAAARAARLELRATTAGYVLTPDVEKLVGVYVAPYSVVLRLGDNRQLKLVVPLTEDEAQMVTPGAPVTGRWLSTAEPFHTALDALSSQPAKPTEFQTGMLAFFGGPVPTQMLQRDVRDRPDYPIFIASAPMPKPDFDVPDGMRVRITIEGNRTTFGAKTWRWILSWLDLKSKAVRR